MSRARVHQIAKELGISSKQFIEYAESLGFTYLTSHANTVEDSDAVELRRKIRALQGNPQPVVKPTVLRRRAVPAMEINQTAPGKVEVVVTRHEGDQEIVIERKQISLPLPPVFSSSRDFERDFSASPLASPPLDLPLAVGSAPSLLPPPSLPLSEELSASFVSPASASVSEPDLKPPGTPSVPSPSHDLPVLASTQLPPAASPEAVSIAEPETPGTPAPMTSVVESRTLLTPSPDASQVSASAAEAQPELRPVTALPLTSVGAPSPAEPRPPQPSRPTDKKPTTPPPSPQKAAPPPPPPPPKPKPNVPPPVIQLGPKLTESKANPPLRTEEIKAPAPFVPILEDVIPYEEPDESFQNRQKRGKANKPKEAERGRGKEEFNSNTRKPAKFDKNAQFKKVPQPGTLPMSEKKRVIKVNEAISVSELAHRMGIKGSEILKSLLLKGVMATINKALSVEEATDLARQFGYEVQSVGFEEETILQNEGMAENPKDLQSRPPVVTVMGHVDHGKTSLLDAIRKSRVAAQEAGGITQHIGASVVQLDPHQKIVFLDTPGHEAFTSMRARGAQCTDIVILVVAADDGIMPQTIEAINHAQAAHVPIVVAINKIDKQGADPSRVRYDLMKYSLVDESLGGSTLMVEVSAHTRQGIPQLLETVLLQAEIMELKANFDKRAHGTVLESRLEKGRGPVSTLLVQEGTLRVGDAVVVGSHYGRIRAMFDDQNNTVEIASPSIPVLVLGLSGLPTPGDGFDCVADERSAKQVAEHRQDLTRRQEQSGSARPSLANIWGQDAKKELNIILKADMQGSLEALRDSLLKIQHKEIELSIPLSAVGGISESDINLAATTNSIIVGFQVRPDANAQRLAETQGVEIRIYRVIYDLINDVKGAMEKKLAPTLQEKPIGQVEIREVFTISKVGKVAGCYVTDGKITRNALIRLYRNNIQIYEGKISSLRRFKNDAREVASGYECGLQIDGYQDIRAGDLLEAYEIEQIETKLES